MAKTPQILKNYNLFVDGQGFAGLMDEVTLPTLALQIEDHRAGGMDASMPIDMGMENLELGFTCAEHSPAIFRQFGLSDQNAVALVFRGALADNETVIPYVITCKGMYTEISGASVSAGDKVPLESTVRCNYYKLSHNGQDLIEVDILNMVRRINGVDQLAAIRNAINA